MAQKISIVIPVFNEEESLPGLITQLQQTGSEFEIIFVDDCSTDGSPEILASTGFRVIRHDLNTGYGSALKTGIRAASGDLIAIIDSDGQHKVSELAKLFAETSGHDMVVGQRGSGGSVLRRPGKFLLKLFAGYLSGRKIPDLNSGMRVFRRDFILRCLPLLPDGFSFTTTVTMAALVDGFRVRYVPVEVEARTSGHSRVGMFRDGLSTLYLILKMMIFFNPLKVFLPTSVLFFMLAGVDLIYEWYHISYQIPDSFILLFLAGMNFFFFGVLADMLATMRKWR
ncbi:MAG: glycosyltransferase family 2 protein [Candidatus Wallbacteria bacterium]|nr:glycosyltransferase family 2 protein [Candidatus Wallbacteria bacterium]